MSRCEARRLSVSADATHLLADGRPTMLCADTVWSAFGAVSAPEWSEYLRLRRMQGFNALLISILPILHDRSVDAGSRHPFAMSADGCYDYDRPDEGYFDQARLLCREAVAMGMTPMLVVLWCNYVAGTWGAEKTPAAPMSSAQRAAYLARVVGSFADLEPVFVVSGDDHLRDPLPIATYRDALDVIKALAPHCLTTLHSTPDTDLPPVLAEAPSLDFYTYQSGHFADRQSLAHTLAAKLLAKKRRPVMNAEPCYEAHGRSGGEGRFSTDDVRRATWWSLAGGASAGIAYGAHGVWQWHRSTSRFNNAGFSLDPLTWGAALALPGAWDVGFAAATLAEFGLEGAEPRQDFVVEGGDGLRVAEKGGRLLAYVPFAQAFALRLERTPAALTAYDLASRRRLHLEAAWHDGALTVAQADLSGDMLLLIST